MVFRLPMNFSFTSIKVKLFISLLATGLLAVVVMGTIVYRYSKERLVGQQGIRLRNLAAAALDKIDRNLFERAGDVRVLAVNPAVLGSVAQLAETADYYVQAYGFYDLIVVADGDGKIVAVNSVGWNGRPVNSAPLLGRSVKGEEWFKKIASGVVERGEIYFGDLTADKWVAEVYGTRGLALNFAAPIYGRDGRLLRVWSNRVSWDRLTGGILKAERLALQAEGMRSLESQIVGPTGLVLDDADPRAVLSLNLAEAGLEAARLVIAGRSGYTEELHKRRGVMQLNGYAASRGTAGFAGHRWGLLMRQDLGEATQIADSLRVFVVLAGLGLSATVAALAFWIARGIAGPLVQSVEVLEAVAAGDLTRHIEVRSRDEIGRMGVALNRAVASIKAALQRVQEEGDRALALERGQREAEAASAAKTRFLATMSHEMRTPLNAVIGVADILLGSRVDADQRQLIETVRQSGSDLLRLINDILDFSKLEADKVGVESIDFNLREVVRGAFATVEYQASAKGLSLVSTIAPKVPEMVTADPGRLRQIFINLLGNAVKFSAAGRIELTVEVSEQNSDGVLLWFRVTDQGIGIAPEAQARLFEPFSQADSSTTRKYGGTGLGLAISKRLAELMGGELRVDSGVGVGTCFTLILFSRWVAPKTEALTASVESAPTKPPASEPGRILLVDDNPVNQMVALRLLQMLGYRADTAADGVEAVDAATATDYELLLMDCEMPNMDGYQATAAIRRLEADSGRRSRIVAMTANAMDGDREKCLAAGMDDYLAKPIQLDTLKATLERCL